MTRASARRWRVTAIGTAIVLLAHTVVFTQATPTDWQSLDSRVNDLYTQGDLAGATDAANAALAAATTPAQRGRSLDRLGFLLYTAGKLDDGGKYLQESLQLRESTFGADSLDYAETANDLAMLLRDTRSIEQARVLAERALATRRRLLPDNDPLLAESLNTAGTVYGIGGDYARAVTLFEEAVAIHERQPQSARANEEYGTLCINLAGTYQRVGKYALAESTFAKGLAALKVKPGVDHPAYAASLVAYAFLEADLGRFADAERAYDEGGRRMEATLTKQHPLYASFLNNRGSLYQTIGNSAAAEADYRASLALKRELHLSGTSIAASLRNLAYLVYARDHAEGERLLREAVDAYAGTANAPPFDYTSVLLGLARAERDRGALADARETVDRALAVAQKGLSAHHPLVANALRERGLIEAASGDTASAERTLREAIEVAESAHGAAHPALAAFVDSLAELYTERGDYAAALPLYQRSFDLRDRFVGDVLEIGAESAKTLAVAAASDSISPLLAYQAKAAAQVPAARVLAFEVVAQRKARVLDQVRDWRQRLRANPDPAIQRTLHDWEAILGCRTSLTVALGYADVKPGIVGLCSLEGTDLQGRYERLLSDLRTARTDDLAAQAVRAIDVLRARGDTLEASLNRNGGVSPSTPRISLDAIRHQLGGDELLVEFVSFDDEAPPAGRRYGAFVLASDGRLDWVDLGAAKPIDDDVGDLLAAANDWTVSIRNHESSGARSSEQTARDALADLSRRAWKPVARAVDSKPGVHRLRIAPDGLLDLVPFEALSDGRELIDRFAIAYVPSGRDLAAADASPAASSAPVVVVSPGASKPTVRPESTQARAFRADALAPLPSAAAEASDLRRLIPDAELFSRADATERHVKQVHGPSLLHIIGHGIVVGGDPGGLDRSSNAMSLSAIVLEEAYGRASGSTEDGMLTPLELQNIDLHGTEMLVLSQCQMASGVASVGEGVYGMRRAAAIAGAHSFVAPLWNVEDSVERTLMARFYQGLAAGQSRADALRIAKLAVRRTPATRSFLYWAPVILSGSVAPIPRSVFERAR